MAPRPHNGLRSERSLSCRTLQGPANPWDLLEWCSTKPEVGSPRCWPLNFKYLLFQILNYFNFKTWYQRTDLFQVHNLRVRVQVRVLSSRVRVLTTSTRVLVLVPKTQVDRVPVAYYRALKSCFLHKIWSTNSKKCTILGIRSKCGVEFCTKFQ